jgi:hypothetical protein
MTRVVLTACMPWLLLLATLLLVAWGLVRLHRSQVCIRRLWSFHRDQAGSVQSLSFVLTLPFFVMVMLLIVQVSQLMIGTIVVHYAAFAAARSAIVWIPAMLPAAELANCISSYSIDPSAPNQYPLVLDPASLEFAPSEGGITYVITPDELGSPKYNQITAAAVLACAPISPSRDLGVALSGSASLRAEAMKTLYSSMAPASAANSLVPSRLEHKLAYAANCTRVEVRFYHKNAEPPLERPPSPYYRPPVLEEFRENEIGWQDPVTVTVYYDLALLPGPGRLLAPLVSNTGGINKISRRSFPSGDVYVCTLTASATLGNEGEKSVVPYEYGY